MVGASEGPILIFDGECVLCSGTVQFVLAHEADPSMRFSCTQSQAARVLAARHGFSLADLDETFLVIEDGVAHARSEAALRVAAHLKAPWRWLVLARIVPRPLRDWAYSFLARRRYRLFGKMESCFMPSPALRTRFVEELPSRT